MKKVSKELPGEASKFLCNPAIFSVAICHLCLYRERRKLAAVVRGSKMDATRNMHERDRKTEDCRLLRRIIAGHFLQGGRDSVIFGPDAQGM
jgi:hypothetical protein